MTNLPATKLQALIAKAKQATPATTGETARYEQRHNASGPVLIICDTSKSMEEPAGGGRRRIDHLKDALQCVWNPKQRLMAYSATAVWLDGPEQLPEPFGGTALDLALIAAAGLSPSATLVISDGEPNNEETAFAAAHALTGVINTIYCGPETNQPAIDFMRRLARSGCGRYYQHRWSSQIALAPAIAKMLPAP